MASGTPSSSQAPEPPKSLSVHSWRPSGSSSKAAKEELLQDVSAVSGASSPRVSLEQQDLRSFIRLLCQRIGIEWNDRLGDYLLARSLQEFDLNRDGRIEGVELSMMIEALSKAPRAEARHPINVCVFGGGAFGIAIAVVLARKGNTVKVLFRDVEKEHVDSVNTKHINTMAFPDFVLPPLITATIDPSEALKDVNWIIHAVPVQFSESYLSGLKHLIPADVPILSVSKGISTKTLEFMSEVIPRGLERKDPPVAFLSGPSFAEGIIKEDPTAVTIASLNPLLARNAQTLLSSPTFRVYTTTDVIGVEVGSALKNVLAIAAGLATGLGYGSNTQALLVTRGWADIRKICVAFGANPATLSGLAGIGDLMLTCFSGTSRNHSFGQSLAHTNSVEESLKQSKGVVEGVPTAAAAKQLAMKKGLNLPVLFAIADMLEGKLAPRDMIIYVMTLPLGEED